MWTECHCAIVAESEEEHSTIVSCRKWRDACGIGCSCTVESNIVGERVDGKENNSEGDVSVVLRYAKTDVSSIVCY